MYLPTLCNGCRQPLAACICAVIEAIPADIADEPTACAACGHAPPCTCDRAAKRRAALDAPVLRAVAMASLSRLRQVLRRLMGR